MRILCVGAIAALAVLLPFEEASAHRKFVTVPDVLELSVRRARDRIARAGLHVRLVGDAKERGVRVVTGQHPAAGRRVVHGSLVRITARRIKGATPPRRDQYVSCPRVVGLRASEARSRLERAGLGWTVVSRDAGRFGIPYVMTQHPAAGLRVRKGAKVRLSVKRQPR